MNLDNMHLSEELSIDKWWSRLPGTTQDWLINHNGECLPSWVVTSIEDATGGRTHPAWWVGYTDDSSQLTDAAIDWIEETANGEHRQS